MKAPCVSAYIPCFNSAKTLPDVVASIRSQTMWVDDLFIIDDGSTDDTLAVAESLSVKIIPLSYNCGRGTVRARAMEEAKNEYVLSCDSQKKIAPNFLAKAIAHFEDESVAAVYGRMMEISLDTYVQRWRARHLNRQFEDIPLKHQAKLATGACLLRKSYVMDVGNFNPALRHTEDEELGERLKRSGYDVVFDPEMICLALENDTFKILLKRYVRWNSGVQPHFRWSDYFKQVSYCTKVMAWKDMKESDFMAALVSLVCPHYQYYRAYFSEKTGKKHPTEHTERS